MTRTVAERVTDVRSLLAAARRVYDRREALVAALVASTGLSPEGVLAGFESLERDASEADLRSLVEAAGTANHVHVVLSANVFVAPLRALALARAAAPRVTVRPSPREPVFVRALVEAAGDPGILLSAERDVGLVAADVVHVYGRDETIAAVRAGVRPGVGVVGHGAGLGVAVVTRDADSRTAAEKLALASAAFDQRGCLSPRMALVEGDSKRVRAFGLALHECLSDVGARVPRGALDASERADAVRWRQAMAFAGTVWEGKGHAVGLLDPSFAAAHGAPEAAGVTLAGVLAVPPAGRHVQLIPIADLSLATRVLAPIAPLVVAVGSDEPGRAGPLAPAHARLSALGLMQRPPLDGPVDRRST